LYPAGEDIFSKSKEEGNINPEDISKTKESSDNSKAGKSNEKDFVEDQSGSDLDVPGSELDDEQEKIGSEDEENNYYSLGEMTTAIWTKIKEAKMPRDTLLLHEFIRFTVTACIAA